jgi:hypothetical protein
MAKVEYQSEPTVSLHGVPQSEYNEQFAAGGGEAAPQEGGIIGHLKQHWVIYTIGIGAAGLVIMFLMYRNQNSAANAAVSAGNSASGQVPNPATIDSSWGSQLDADYQQLTSVMTQQTGLLTSILNGITGGPAAPTPTPPGTSPSGSPYTPIMGNQPIHNPMLGQQFSFEGILYQLVPGPSNRIWGVQEPAGQTMTSEQLKAAPIGFGMGQKRLLTTGG